MDGILELLQAHWPIIGSVIIVPGLKWLKRKIQLDWPTAWWVISVITSVGLAMGGSELVGADQATTQLNAAMTVGLTQFLHSLKKTKEKISNGQ